MIDTHSHIQFKTFDQDRSEVIQRALAEGVEKIIAVGTDVESSKKAVEIAKEYSEVYAAVGIHPHHVFGLLTQRHPEELLHGTSKGGSDVRILLNKELCSPDPANKIATLEDSLAMTEELLQNAKVVAVGETGLDSHAYPQTKYQNYQITKDFLQLQQKAFVAQIKLAKKYQKTLIIHNRGEADLLIKTLADNWDSFFERRSVFHCCEPDQKLLDFAKKHQVFIGVDGDVTYDRAKQEFIKQVPLELLVAETDSPFFVPEPLKTSGITRNEPANTALILKFLDILTHKNVSQMSRINSLALFKLQ